MSNRDDAQSLQLAFSLHRSGKFAEAAKLYRKVIKRNPREANALHSLGLIEAAAGNLAEAAQLMARSVSVQPNNIQFIQNHVTVLCQLGQFATASEACLKGLALDGANTYLLYVAAGALFKQERLAEALSSFDELLRREPNHLAALAERSLLLGRLQRFDAALADAARAVAVGPQYAEAHLNQGVILGQLKRPEEAIASFETALRLNPNLTYAWLGRGNAMLELKRHDEALAAFDRVLSIAPDFAEAWLGRGNALFDLKRGDEALAAYRQALSFKPTSAEAWARCGNVHAELRRTSEALAAYEKAIALDPGYAEAHLNRGVVYARLGQHDDAIGCFERALELNPGLANAWHGRGNALYELKRLDEALAAFGRALSIASDFAEAWLGHGNVCFDLGRFDEAAADYERALALDDKLAEAWLGRGNILLNLRRSGEALAAFDKALSLRPQSAEAWTGRGNACTDLGRHGEAFQSYDNAFLRKPDLLALEGARLHSKMRICDWANFATESDHLLQSVRLGKENAEPFVLLSIGSTVEDQLQCARAWVRKRYAPRNGPVWQGRRAIGDRIHVGYLSADFRQHPVAQLMAGVIESHDRSRFDVIGVSIGPDDDSDLRRRLERSFSHFVDCAALGDEAVAKKVGELEIDILVDLNGFTQRARTSIFARRPAPLQVNYLGYPGTMGADYIDYIVADPVLIPEPHRRHYQEKVIWLPHSYLPHDAASRAISERRFERGEFGLPESGFVFCCFNNAYKLNPRLFASRMKILNAVEGSVLWLSRDNDTVVEHLCKEAAAAGVDPARLIFADRMPSSSEHLARHRLADLFLDTLPYNAHTTASDALWTGLPVLTQLGDTFAGRVAASLLTAIGLSELIAQTEAQFERLAIELASDPGRLAAVTAKLAQNRFTQPLFDTSLYARHLEQAYETMLRRHQDGLPPDHIDLRY